MNLDAEIAFHIITLIYQLCVSKYAVDGVDFSKTTDPLVLEMKQFQCRYLTTWNWIMQIVYLCVSLLHDVFRKYLKNNTTIEHKLQQLKSYIFVALVFPFTVYVTLMFWTLYTINREWVLPEASDIVFPSWYNHCVHTNILIFLVMETLLTNHRLPSFKSAFSGLTFALAIYYSVFFYTYFERRRWLYGLFYSLNWCERIIFMIFNYFVTVLYMKLGLIVQKIKHKTPNNHSLNIKLKGLG